MNTIERSVIVVLMLFISVCAISWIGKEYHALLAAFELLAGIIIGMTVFIKR